MLKEVPKRRVYLAAGVTDLRNNIDGLALIVEKQFRLDVFSESLFVFCNRKRNKIKILYWDNNGFWLYYKRLEEGTFRWPAKEDGRCSIEVTRRQLDWLLDGLNIIEPKAHKEVKKRKLI